MPQPDVSGDMPEDIRLPGARPVGGHPRPVETVAGLRRRGAGAGPGPQWGAWKLGYAASLEANGTYADRYAAAKAEGTFEEGRAAGYEEGYQTGYTEGLQEGFDQGKSTGIPRDIPTEALTCSRPTATPSRPWTRWRTTAVPPGCGRPGWVDLPSGPGLPPAVGRQKRPPLGEAEDAGYSPCSRCAKKLNRGCAAAKKIRTWKVGVHKTVNSHSLMNLHCCGCSCVISCYV